MMRESHKWLKSIRRGVASLAMLHLALRLFLGGCAVEAEEKHAILHPALSAAEFQAYVVSRQVPILDARDAQSYNAGHVPGALNLPPGKSFLADYKKLEPTLARHKESLVIVYCADRWCDRSDELQMQLIAQGYQHVARFPGGWMEWQRARRGEDTTEPERGASRPATRPNAEARVVSN
jgi:rhodanese-related sulfurtransferase